VQLIVSRVAGTSYSAAEVSGIVALILQHAPRLSSGNVRNIDRLGGQNAPLAQARPIERMSTGRRRTRQMAVLPKSNRARRTLAVAARFVLVRGRRRQHDPP
jgi:hypothetical protein